MPRELSPRRSSADRLLSGVLPSLACALFAIASSEPASAIVIFDLHYQGQDEIELSDLPADGRITLDLDISWDGEPQGLAGIGISTRFDPVAASFVGGTTNRSTLFANPFGGDGFLMGRPPHIVRDWVDPAYWDFWAINDVSTVNAIRLPAPDHPGLEANAFSLTFDVRDVATFDLLFGEGDGLLFAPPGGGLTGCFRSANVGAGDVRYDQAGCIAAGLVAFDGFRVVDRGRVADSPIAIFEQSPVPEPGSATLIALGLGMLARRPRRA